MRLAEAEETLRAIRNGEVDAVMVAGKQGPQVFTLQGAEYAYRMLIESINEGALTLTADKMILYANQCFARMVKCPLEQVVGSSFRRFLSAEDRATLKPLLKRAGQFGSKIQVRLNVGDGSDLPAQISIRQLSKNGPDRAAIAMVVTDMTEARRTEEMLRAFSHRLVQLQEAERGRVALELHDHITQLLCAGIFRSQALAEKLSVRDGPAKNEAMKLCEMLSTTAEEVQRISRNLRPNVLDDLGLAAALYEASTEFTDRTGVSIKLVGIQLPTRLPADTELTLYRIFQEALKNVDQHAQASNVTVCLRQQGSFVHLVITDDGIGFDPDQRPDKQKGKGSFSLISMRERTTYLGGTIKVKSDARVGTEIEVSIPLPPSATMAAESA
jgi:two-component system NarL family sensor kinase